MKKNKVVYIQNLKQRYYHEEKHKLVVTNRSRYPNLTYDESDNYEPTELLPQTSYYSVVNERTGETVIEPSKYTKLSHDLTTNYFYFDMSSLDVGQYYRFRIHIYTNTEENVYDNSMIFKIEKN